MGDDVIRRLDMAVLLIAGFGTAACSSGSFSTGSIFGGSSPPVKAATVNDPNARALQVAATSARAAKCGYHFDPARLRSGFLAAEAAAGTPVPEIAKAETAYDLAFRRVSASIDKPDEFCTDDQTREIKADLSRHLAGDYAPRMRYVPPTTVAGSSGPEPMDRERISNPTGVRSPKPVE
jgi:hypothetical protein